MNHRWSALFWFLTFSDRVAEEKWWSIHRCWKVGNIMRFWINWNLLSLCYKYHWCVLQDIEKKKPKTLKLIECGFDQSFWKDTYKSWFWEINLYLTGLTRRHVLGHIYNLFIYVSKFADQIGLTPEEVISKIMANPDVAMAFQNPRIQQAIMDVCDIYIRIYLYFLDNFLV